MSLRSFLLGLPLGAGLLVFPGCVAAPPEDGEIELLGSANGAIKGGYADTADVGVVGVGFFEKSAVAGHPDDLVGICTGSLIAPNVVLTAHHCVADVLNQDPQFGIVCSKTSFSPPFSPARMGVTTHATMGSVRDTSYHRVTEIVTQPGTTLLCGNDQAILILADNIAPGEAKVLVPRVDSEIAANDEYYAVGYGATEDSQSGTGAGTRRRRDKLFIACPGADCPAQVRQSVKSVEFLGDQGICEGDSGGPSIDLENRVIGITSRGGPGCTDPVYSDVFGAGQWVKDTTLHGAKVGGYTAPAWATGYPTDPVYNFPIGGACAAPADCESNSCVSDGVATYCTRPCSETAFCPEGFTCETEKFNVCVQNHPPPVVSKPTKGVATAQAGGCSISAGDDPTKPVPWLTGGVVIAALALRRRRAS